MGRVIRRTGLWHAAKAYQGTCVICSAEFLTAHPYTLYCSGACSQKAHRERRRNRLPLPQVEPRQLQLPPIASASDLEARSWQGTPIHRRQRDGWVNATAMCQAGGKRWNNYERGDRTQEYVVALREALAAETDCGAAVAQNRADVSDGSTRFCADPSLPPVIESITTGLNEHRGTWVHPRLAVDLARWISPAFAVWMDGWFLEATSRTAPHHQPTTPGITVAARTEREAMQLWQAAVEAEATRALRLTLGTTGRTDAGLRPTGPWRFVAC